MPRAARYVLRVKSAAHRFRIITSQPVTRNPQLTSWILHESEAFICKALKAKAIVNYASALITQQMEASGSPEG